MLACSLDYGDELNDEFVNTWINAMGQDTCQNIQNDIDYHELPGSIVLPW